MRLGEQHIWPVDVLDHRDAGDEVDGIVGEWQRIISGPRFEPDVRRGPLVLDAEVEADALAETGRETHKQITPEPATQIDRDAVVRNMWSDLTPPEGGQESVDELFVLLPV